MEGFVFTDKLPVEDYLRLRAEAGWKVLPPDQAQAGLDRSFANIAVVCDGEVVGMARIVWDHGYCAFLTDVIVTEKHRHNGLASEMIRRLTEKIRAEKKDGWQIAVYLMAAKDREGFYERLGFRTRPDERVGAGMDMWL
ncbi:MAG: GNAT family N-acetyltransferase [Oscillospiraceae bacterium]|nr:GNAT family N-acetyltransferase [Oscillospiraceae bacterium]